MSDKAGPRLLAEFLQGRGMKKGFLARAVDVSPDRVGAWLAGRATPAPKVRQRLADFTGGFVKPGDWE